MERTFSAKMAATGDHVYAAEKAGYAFPAQAAAKLVRHAGVQADMSKRIDDEIQNDLAPLATWRLRKVLLDDEQKGSTHVNACKVVLAEAQRRTNPAAERDSAELTHAELLDQLALANRRMAELKVVEHVAPAAAPESPESAQPAPNLFD